MESWLQDNDTEMYSTQNEGKFVVAERFIKSLINKIYKYMISVSKNVYINKLDDMVNKYNNTYYNTIKMKPIDEISSTYIDFGIEDNGKDPKFKVGDNEKISKYKNIFAKRLCSKLVRRSVINDLNDEEIVGTFYEKRISKNKSKSV